MNNKIDTYIKSLLKVSKGDYEVSLYKQDQCIKIDLKPENLLLWKETYEKLNHDYNLLLSCESSDLALSSNSLTWVVGSAIRPTKTNTNKEALELLVKLGVTKVQSEIIQEYCKGLGDEICWAFYLDRHSVLTTSPLIDSQSIANLVRNQEKN